jgi:BirA family biotin operon repressor/biotin-[acetyl-CoA-carboxylase] ligase
MLPDDLLPRRLQEGLTTRRLGRRLIVLPTVGSTNDLALELARAGEPEGAVVLADHQRRGRGRTGRRWESPPGKNLLFSVILRPPGSPRQVLPITLVSGLVLAEALERWVDRTVQLRWPNDLLVDGRKLGGLLAEASARPEGLDFLVLGIGININAEEGDFPEALRGDVTSCRMERGEPVPRDAVWRDLVRALEEGIDAFAERGFSAFREAYRRRSVLWGRRVRCAVGGEEMDGWVVGLGGDGELIVETDGRERTLWDVDWIREAP